MATTSTYALRLLASLKAEAEKVAAAEGTTLNQFINIAVAEKLGMKPGKAAGADVLARCYYRSIGPVAQKEKRESPSKFCAAWAPSGRTRSACATRRCAVEHVQGQASQP